MDTTTRRRLLTDARSGSFTPELRLQLRPVASLLTHIPARELRARGPLIAAILALTLEGDDAALTAPEVRALLRAHPAALRRLLDALDSPLELA